jgi:phosphoglycolate phosphatase
MLIQRPDAIIFDWDDTLVDSYGAIHVAINAARMAFDLPVWSLEEARQNCRRALAETFPQWFGTDWQRAQQIFYASFAEQHIAQLHAQAGAAELLAWLQSKPFKLAVNSNKKSAYLHKEIMHLGWAPFFSCIVGAGDVARGKPAPDGVRLIREKLKISDQATVWYIGDNEVDVATAEAGACLPVIIGPTAHREAAYNFPKLAELQNKLAKL